MASYTLNQELNGIEISFDQKPDTDTLTALKSAGYRWHRIKKVWYAKQTAERISIAARLTGQPEQPTEAPKKSDQDELKALYMDIICKEVWASPRMQEYARKNAAYIVPLDNGDITDIDKPSIETSFCFGYGYCGVSTQEDEDRASKAEQTARTDQDYFIRENMRDIDGWIEALTDDHYYFYKYTAYTGQPDNSHLKHISYCKLGDTPEYNPGQWSNVRSLEKLTDNEKAALLTGYQEVKKAFMKRLNTYLKRYGLSKLNTWTYLSD